VNNRLRYRYCVSLLQCNKSYGDECLNITLAAIVTALDRGCCSDRETRRTDRRRGGSVFSSPSTIIVSHHSPTVATFFLPPPPPPLSHRKEYYYIYSQWRASLPRAISEYNIILLQCPSGGPSHSVYVCTMSR